jgi:diguanylate cyclase (GGDEF)-like protein/PAS domain S-box-containing protein
MPKKTTKKTRAAGRRPTLAQQLARCRAKVRELTESESGHRRFVQNITEGYFFYRHDRRRAYRFLSPSVRRVLGYSPQEYVDGYAKLFTDSPINAEAIHRTDRALAGQPQGTFEAEVLAKDGSIHRLEITEYPVFDEKGDVALIEGIAHDVTEMRSLEARLIEMATHDELTGLFNRRHFCFRLDEAIALARRHDFPLTAALVDLDRLKAVNDSFGHAAGDRMIQEAAEVLQREVRRGDTAGRLESAAGRLGGDEFAVVLPYARAEGAIRAMERLLSTFAETRVDLAPGAAIPIAASVGVAELQPDLDGSTLQSHADEALYSAKRLGRGRIVVWRGGA